MPPVQINSQIEQKLRDYAELLTEWNNKMNLISRSDIASIWDRHIMDCLQLMAIIGALDKHVVDVGSGAGLPGIVLSIAGVKKVTLVESITKKTKFLEEAAKISGNQIEIVNKRVEDIKIDCDIITARAFASLPRLINLCQHLPLRGFFLLPKGRSHNEEIQEAKRDWSFDCAKYNSVSSGGGVILKISNIKKNR